MSFFYGIILVGDNMNLEIFKRIIKEIATKDMMKDSLNMNNYEEEMDDIIALLTNDYFGFKIIKVNNSYYSNLINSDIYNYEVVSKNDILEDKDVSLINQFLNNEITEQEGIDIIKKIVEEINKILMETNDIHIEGANNVVDLPEFKKVDLTKEFLNVLNSKDLASEIMTAGITENIGDISVYVGQETEKEELKNFSIITFNHLLEDKDIGKIAIIGPKRMDYSKVVSVMKYISKKINDDYKKGKL